MPFDREHYDKGIDHLTKKLADDGFLIEAGWVGLRYAALPADAPEIQVREMRKAFFSGAQHLFASIMSFMETEEEPTANDMRRMEMLSVELDGFVDSLKREVLERR